MLRFPVIQDMSDFELTPLYTSCEYAGPVSSYMPLMTARFAFVKDAGAVIEISSFEEHPVEDPEGDLFRGNILSAAFCFFPGSSATVLRIVCGSSGRCVLYENGDAVSEETLPVFRGEDERGFYWGVRYTFPSGLLRRIYGRDLPGRGETVKGNVFKCLLEGTGKHFGAVAPVPAGADLFAEDNLQDMSVMPL